MNNLNNIVDYLKVFNNIETYKKPEPRNMYAGGQLVTPSADGSRPGYDGRKDRGRDIHQEKKFKKSEKIKTLTRKILKQNSEIKNGYKVLKINPGSVSTKSKNNIFQKVLTAAGGKDKVNVINLSKVFNEIVKNENFLSSDNYRRQIIIDVFMDDYANNGQFTGEGKLDSRLAEFKGPARQTYTGINKTFREWANGDFEVDGFDRSTFDETTKKNLKNWKPIDNVNDRRIQVRKELKFLNNLNNTKPNLPGDEVKKLFTKEFKTKNNPYWRETSFVNRTTQLYPHKIYGKSRSGIIIEGIDKGNRSSWLQEAYAGNKSGNFTRVLVAADAAEANGDVQLAKQYRKAAKELFMLKTGVISKIPGQAEHPWFHNYGKGLFQIDSIVKGDLNYFKRQNFEVPIRNLKTEYESKTKPPTLARKKAIESEINLRRKFLNTMTDIGDGGMARNVTFDFKSEPGKIKITNTTPDIYQLHKTGKLDPLELQTKGTAYRTALIKNLTKADYNIIKRGTDVMKTQKIGAEKISSLLEKLGCPKGGKASGGRVGFATGATCATKGREVATRILRNGTASTEQKAILRQMVGAGSAFLKGTAKFAGNILSPKEFFKLRNWVGPEAAAFMAAFEGGFIGYDVINNNTPIKEALGANWMTSWAMPKTMDEYQIEEMREKGGFSNVSSERFAQSQELVNELNRDYTALQVAKQGSYMTGVDNSEEVARKQKAYDAKEAEYFSFVGEGKGMDPYEFEKDRGRMLEERGAGKFVPGEVKEDMFGFYVEGDTEANEPPKLRVNEYGYKDVADETVLKALSPEGWFEQGSGALPLKKSRVPIYDLPPSEIAKMDLEAPFEQDLDWASNMKKTLKDVHEIKTPGDYRFAKHEKLTEQDIEDLTNYYRAIGKLKEGEELEDMFYEDTEKSMLEEAKIANKWSQLYNYPGMQGSQDPYAEGGLAGLMKKKW